jgi:pimeloyl-ACP methyl ester carboxylesterase
MTKKHSRLDTGAGGLHVMTWLPENSPRALVIFSHGFTVPGFESRRMFLDIAARIVGLDMGAILFDYRGSGYSDRTFEDITIHDEITDLRIVLEYTESLYAKVPIALWGMSLGTAVAAEVAAVRPDRVEALIMWCVSTRLHERFRSRYDAKRLAEGRLYLPSGFLVTERFVDALADVDTLGAISRLHMPKLFVTGTADEQTSAELAREAFGAAPEPKVLCLIPDGNHGFKGQPELFDESVSSSLEWLMANLFRQSR